jgi:ABC-type glycerol-3-phosphate transport system substrate-binding protein
MNKKILIILGALVGLSLIGIIAWVLIQQRIKSIDSQPQNTTNSGQQEAGESITIEYWGLWEPESVMQPLIDNYEATHPNIKIKYIQKSFYQYERTVFTRIQQSSETGTPTPDIIRIHNTWMPKFAPYLSPLPETVMNTDTFSQRFYSVAKSNAVTSTGEIKAIPIEIDGLAIFYNKQLLQEIGETYPPVDWDEMIAIAKKLTKRDSSGKITQAGLAMGGSNVLHSAEILQLLFLQNNAQIADLNGQVNLTNSSRVNNAVDFYMSFAQNNSDRQTWDTGMSSDLEMFASGKLAFMIAPSWRVFDVLAMNPQIEFDLAPVPQLSAEDMNINLATYWMEAVPAKSQHPQEAWEFINWLSEEQQLKSLYSNISGQLRAFGEPFPLRDLSSDIASEPYVGAILQMAPTMNSFQYVKPVVVETALKDLVKFIETKQGDTEEAINNAQSYIDSQ